VTDIVQALDRFRHEPTPPEGSARNAFKLVSTVGGPPNGAEVRDAWGATELPTDVVELWRRPVRLVSSRISSMDNGASFC
jgi:hypothetical protein